MLPFPPYGLLLHVLLDTPMLGGDKLKNSHVAATEWLLP